MAQLTIGKVAGAAGVGVDTVRFYEKQGLIAKPARRASGYRVYDASVVARLRFIRRAKELGFTLREIKELLALRVDRKANCASVKRRADAKIADIDERLRVLRKMKRTLKQLSASCARGTAPSSECPILASLAKD